MSQKDTLPDLRCCAYDEAAVLVRLQPARSIQELLFQELIDRLRIGLPRSGFHDLPHEKTNHFLFPPTHLLRLIGKTRYHVVYCLGNGVGICDLGQSLGLD